MIMVKTADLKQQLSRYLGRVRTGQKVEVTSHGRVVARLVPVSEGRRLALTPPCRPVSDLKHIHGVRLATPLDPLAILAEDRRRR